MICTSSNECSSYSNLTCRNNVCDCNDTNFYWDFSLYKCGRLKKTYFIIEEYFFIIFYLVPKLVINSYCVSSLSCLSGFCINQTCMCNGTTAWKASSNACGNILT